MSKSNLPVLARIQQGAIVRSINEANALLAALAEAPCHLVAPAPQVSNIPEMFGVSVTSLHVNPDTETYPIPGSKSLGIKKPALFKIAAMAGITWDPHESRRLDDRQDPHLVHYRAVGTVTDFDGTPRVIIGEKRIDLRKGGADYEEIVRIARVRDRSPEGEISAARRNILSLAQTKAQLRAVRSLGLKTSYTRRELQNPFVVAKLQFTGQTDDPELRKLAMTTMLAARFGARNVLYGQHEPPPMAIDADGVIVEETGSFEDDTEPPAPPEPRPRQEQLLEIKRLAQERNLDARSFIAEIVGCEASDMTEVGAQYVIEALRDIPLEADTDDDDPEPKAEEPASTGQLQALRALAKSHFGITPRQFTGWLKKRLGTDTPTFDQAATLIGELGQGTGGM